MDNLFSLRVSSILSVDTIASPKGRVFSMTARPSYGLTFCSEGQITYTHQGHSFVSDPQHALLLPQGESYSLFTDKKGLFPLINFYAEDFSCREILVFPLKNPESYLQDFQRLKTCFLLPRGQFEMLSLFYRLLHRLTSTLSVPPALSPALSYLEKHFDSPSLTAETLASLCDFSPIHFRRLFLQSFGMPPKQYLIALRLARARQLLSEGILSIGEVALSCGFQSAYHFCRLFKAKCGMTPGEYRRKHHLTQI